MISGNKEIGLGTKIYIQPSPAQPSPPPVAEGWSTFSRGRGRVVGKQIYPATGADWAPRALELSTNLRDVSQCPEKAPTKFLKAAQAWEDKHPNFIST